VYKRQELKLGKKTASQISPLVKEWADMVLFANYKTIAVASDKDGKKYKAQGGGRVMYTLHHPCWDAKNRHGLPEEMEFDYSGISHIFNNNTVSNHTAPVTPTQPEPNASTVPAPIPIQPEPPVTEPVAQPKPLYEPNIPDDIPKALADLMRANGVDESEIRQAVFTQGHYPYETPIKNYDPRFVQGCLVGAWDKVFQVVSNNRDLPFE
jgi:hypothetical protein